MVSLVAVMCCLTMAICGVVCTEMYVYRANWRHCSGEDPLLTLMTLSVQSCIRQCRLRNACMAVNFWRVRRVCDLLLTDAGIMVHQNDTHSSCIFIKKSDVTTTSPSLDMAACSSCDKFTSCNTATSTCDITECRKLDVANAVVRGNLLATDSKVKVVCDSSYALATSQSQSTCKGDGTWRSPPTCVLNDCGPPSAQPNAGVSVGDTLSGTVRTYTCLTGYVARNVVAMTTTCQTSGAWSAVSFDCVWDCGIPPVITDASVSLGDTVDGTVLTYTCNTGHVAQNVVTMTTTCVLGGTWSAASFDCILDCGLPAAQPNAGVSVGDTLSGTVRTYTCLTGYVTRNVVAMTTTCQTSGAWSAVSFDCVWDCGIPPVATDASVSLGDTVDGTLLTYTCNTGHVAQNVVTMTTTCVLGGTWSAASFDCILDCGTPPVVVSATLMPGQTVSGAVRMYTCDAGYVATGSTSVTCQAGGTWTTAPTCALLGCPTGWFLIDQSCYFSPGSGAGYERNFFAALDYCHGLSAYLLQLETEVEANAVESYIYNNYGSTTTVWLGITDNGTEGTWRWYETGDVTTFLDWNNGQPNGGTADNYVRLRETGNWGDIEWSQDRQPMCEKSALNP